MIVALAGGVGGAKLADGLAAVLGGDLSVVVNTGDDFEHFGLAVSPDLDTVMYTLAGIAAPETGWGISGETWNFLDLATRLGGPAWFRIGDRDLATHVLRSERLRRGERLTLITADPLPRSKRRRARSCKGSPTTNNGARDGLRWWEMRHSSCDRIRGWELRRLRQTRSRCESTSHRRRSATHSGVTGKNEYKRVQPSPPLAANWVRISCEPLGGRRDSEFGRSG
jgi:2-phospho-L-lactate transferase CofD